MTSWHSLFFPSDDTGAVIATLNDSLMALGYERYNPFGLLPGKAYPQTVRLFVAPSTNGWVRVIGQPDERQLPALTASGLCMWVALDAADARLTVYQGNAPAEPAIALAPYLRSGCLPDQFRNVVQNPAAAGESGQTALPLDALPEDVRALAGKVNPKQAEKLFSRLGDQLMRKAAADSGAAESARGLLGGGPDWNSPGGTWLRAILACLTIPDQWREPDFVTLRDAYQLHERRRRKPDARLYPGDAETMARVPDALAYLPIYGGINP